MKYNLLVVTDHSTHTDTNSVYDLTNALRLDDRCNRIWVSSRGLARNQAFFSGHPGSPIHASEVKDKLLFDPAGHFFLNEFQVIDRADVEVILIRMPQPLDPVFLYSLTSIVPPHRIINSPAGSVETSSKAFLLTVSHLCPEPVLCNSLAEAVYMSHQKEIVLKPLYSYGGKGIIRLSKEYCWNADERHDIGDLHFILHESQFPMMAFRFLHNVVQGDKRTIVVNHNVLGSALRLPAPGSWMCNVAQGGHAVLDEADEDERIIERQLTPMLYRKGVIIYGFDTLVGDDGRRVLSEINTLSIGGLAPLQELSGKPVLHEAASLLWDYIEEV